MAIEISMPKLGMTMKVGLVTKWLKQVGDPVAQGETLLEVTTEKLTQEVDAPADGFLRAILVREGEEVPVGTLLGWIGAKDEAPPAETPQPPAPIATEEEKPSVESELRITPVARRLAKDMGIDLSRVPSSGGRVGREEVLAYIEAQKKSIETVPSPAEKETMAPPEQRIEIIGMRKAIASHMVQSLHEAAQLTVANEVDVTELVRLRESIQPGFQNSTGMHLTYTDMLIALIAQALKKHPMLNSTIENNAVILHENVNMGIAIAIKNGLVAPVIRAAESKTLEEISSARIDLIRKANEGKLTEDDLSGGTFTVTNPGLPGSDLSTPILNSPQNAILAIGRFTKKPAVYQDAVCIRTMCWLSLTFDHRAMDGIPVAAFLETLTQMLQNPYRYRVLSGLE